MNLLYSSLEYLDSHDREVKCLFKKKLFDMKISIRKKNRNKIFLSNIRKIQLFSKDPLSKYNPSYIN